MTRRNVLKGALALAVYIAIPIPIKAKEIKSPYDLFQDGLEKGIIEGLTFNFDKPIVLKDLDNLVIQNCTFNFSYKGKESLITLESCNHAFITNCIFNNDYTKASGITIKG